MPLSVDGPSFPAQVLHGSHYATDDPLAADLFLVPALLYCNDLEHHLPPGMPMAGLSCVLASCESSAPLLKVGCSTHPFLLNSDNCSFHSSQFNCQIRLPIRVPDMMVSLWLRSSKGHSADADGNSMGCRSEARSVPDSCADDAGLDPILLSLLGPVQWRGSHVDLHSGSRVTINIALYQHRHFYLACCCLSASSADMLARRVPIYTGMLVDMRSIHCGPSCHEEDALQKPAD